MRRCCDGANCPKIRLGAVLGYLLAGIIIGPFVLGFIRNVNDILHFSELGVVFLMFLIGLELKPSKLWELRRSILVWEPSKWLSLRC